MGAAKLDQLKNDCVAAIEAGNYSAAMQLCLAARAELTLTPDYEREAVSIRWRQEPEKVFKDLEKLARQGAGANTLRTLKIERKSINCGSADY